MPGCSWFFVTVNGFYHVNMKVNALKKKYQIYVSKVVGHIKKKQ